MFALMMIDYGWYIMCSHSVYGFTKTKFQVQYNGVGFTQKCGLKNKIQKKYIFLIIFFIHL